MTEPIISIHGDHGPDFVSPQYKSTIFSALYFPGAGNEDFYPNISPATYFRLVQNQYFGMQNEILPDISYLADFRSRPDQYPVIFNYGRRGD